MLMWIKSYLTIHRQKVKLGDSFSDAFSLPYGVPKVLSWFPRFLLFTPAFYHPLSHIISSFNVTHHLYADDTQIYLAHDSRNFDSNIAELTECLACIQKWTDGIRLKLNPKKTEFTIIGDRHARESLVQKFSTQFLRNSIFPINDSGNTFASHITKVCCACYYHFKDFRCIRKFLNSQCGDCSPPGKLNDQLAN